MLLRDLTMIEFPTLKLILRQEISPKDPQSHYKMQSSTQKAGPSKDLLKISKIKRKEKKEKKKSHRFYITFIMKKNQEILFLTAASFFVPSLKNKKSFLLKSILTSTCGEKKMCSKPRADTRGTVLEAPHPSHLTGLNRKVQT